MSGAKKVKKTTKPTKLKRKTACELEAMSPKERGKFYSEALFELFWSGSQKERKRGQEGY